jgi:hypothetical protein
MRTPPRKKQKQKQELVTFRFAFEWKQSSKHFERSKKSIENGFASKLFFDTLLHGLCNFICKIF